jgi:putative transcriptional regulator
MLCSIYTTFMGRKSKDQPGEQVTNRILEVRESRGISRQDFATAIDVHYQTVGYLERGEYSPSLALALRISRTLSCSVEDLFALSPDTPAPPLQSPNLKESR